MTITGRTTMIGAFALAFALTGIADADAHHTKRKTKKVAVTEPHTTVETSDRKVKVDAPYTAVRVGKRRVKVRAPYVNINIGW